MSTSTGSRLHVRVTAPGGQLLPVDSELGCCMAGDMPSPQPPLPQGKTGIGFPSHGDQEGVTVLLGGLGVVSAGVLAKASRASCPDTEPWSQAQMECGVHGSPGPAHCHWGRAAAGQGVPGQDHQDNSRWVPGHRGCWWGSGNRAWEPMDAGGTWWSQEPGICCSAALRHVGP